MFYLSISFGRSEAARLSLCNTESVLQYSKSVVSALPCAEPLERASHGPLGAWRDPLHSMESIA